MKEKMFTMMSEMEDLDSIKNSLTSWLKEEVNNGKECFDTKTCGDVSDIIKDMSETKKYCYEACYYKTVIDAMTSEEGPYGYNHKHKMNGQFASSGRGHYVSGYSPGPYMNQIPYVNAYLYDPDFEENMREGRFGMSMGYDSNSGSGKGYRSNNSSRNGQDYDNYQEARRYYHDTKSEKDKTNMEEHCMRYVGNTLGNLKTIWNEADPSLKARAKKDFGEEMVKFLENL